MLDFVVAIIAAVAVAVAWLGIWGLSLRALFGIPLLTRTPEERAMRRERIGRLGKPRYILIFGILGQGLAFGLGITVAQVIDQISRGLPGVLITIVVSMLVLGLWGGVRGWNEKFRGEVPFPPYYPPQK